MNALDRKAAMTGRVGLLLAALVAAVLASVTEGLAVPVLIALALAFAGAACCAPVVIRLGRALKPAGREPDRPQ